MTWFQASLLSFLSAKAPSVNTLLRVLCNQLTESAACFPLLIHLLIHSSSEGWLKTYYIGYLGFCLPPSPPYTNGSQIFLGEPQPSLILNPWALGGVDPTPASSGGRHLIQDGQSEHCIYLATGIGSEMGMLPREDQSKTVGLNSETFVELLEKWPFFPSADNHLATRIQKETVDSTEGWKKTLWALATSFKPPGLKFHRWTFQLYKPANPLLQKPVWVGVLFRGHRNPD